MTSTGIPDWLAAAVAGAGLSGSWTTPEERVALPDGPGAYALALRLDHPVTVALPRGAAGLLAPGWHVYLGSAQGSGGIRARVRRHFRREKPLHWHIDRLTAAPAEIAALAVPGGDECALVARLLATGRFRIAAPGFGSTDCRRCESHLLTAK